MAAFDSLSFALLIPFTICFVLLFIVCCFADEIKDICRLPSPLPTSYIGMDRPPRRHSSRSRGRHGRHGSANVSESQSTSHGDDARNLILNEEGRSRNVSESSTEYSGRQFAVSNYVIVDVINEQPSTSTESDAMQTSGEQSNCDKTNKMSCNPTFSASMSDNAISSSSNFHNNITMVSSSACQDKRNKVPCERCFSKQTCDELASQNCAISSSSRNMSVPTELNSVLSATLQHSLSSDGLLNMPSSEISNRQNISERDKCS